MNHTMDLFWSCFDSLGGIQWFVSLCDNAGSFIVVGMDYILRAF